MSTKVSIIIPAYNAEKFIKNSIKSILYQNFSGELEIIVIDDDSSDSTEAIVSEMSKQNPQIIYTTNNRKKGPSGARNTGLLKASGTYVAFLDADDLWLPNHLEEGIPFLVKNTNIDVVFFNFDISDYQPRKCIGDWFSQRNFTKKINYEKLDNQYNLICDNMFNALLDESFIHLQSMIIRKTALKNILFNEEIKHAEDRDFSIRLYVNSNAKFVFKNVITGIYFRHEQSLTYASIENNLRTTTDQIDLFSEYLSNKSLDPLIALKLKKMLFEKHLIASYYNRQSNNTYLALMSLYKSTKYKISISQFTEFLKIIASFLIPQSKK